MEIRDPVHGDIYVDRVTRDLLDTVAVQRLRGIKQLGLTHLVYPGCVHTRFDHSLGAYHMARTLYTALTGKTRGEEYVAVGAAALLHDVAHIPFGHTLEDEYGLFSKHDTSERLSLMLNGEVGGVLLHHGLYNMVEAILLKTLPDDKRFISEIVSSTIDADVLDYLRRDAYFAGLVHNYDNRVINNFRIVDGRLVYRLVNKGLDRSDSRSELVHLLRLRYYLTERLYYHHAKIAAGSMLVKSIERAKVTEAELRNMSDELLLYICRQRAEEGGDRPLIKLLDALGRRTLYKRAFVYSGDDSLLVHWRNRRNLETVIARAAGLDETEVSVYMGPLGVFKEAKVPVLTRNGIEPLFMGEGTDIRALNEQYRQLCRFYVFAPADKATQVRSVVEIVLGRKSEYNQDLISL